MERNMFERADGYDPELHELRVPIIVLMKPTSSILSIDGFVAT